jgi:hypothetical protein
MTWLTLVLLVAADGGASGLLLDCAGPPPDLAPAARDGRFKDARRLALLSAPKPDETRRAIHLLRSVAFEPPADEIAGYAAMLYLDSLNRVGEKCLPLMREDVPPLERLYCARPSEACQNLKSLKKLLQKKR